MPKPAFSYHCLHVEKIRQPVDQYLCLIGEREEIFSDPHYDMDCPTLSWLLDEVGKFYDIEIDSLVLPPSQSATDIQWVHYYRYEDESGKKATQIEMENIGHGNAIYKASYQMQVQMRAVHAIDVDDFEKENIELEIQDD